MQTLAPTLFPCYGPGNRDLVAEVATFLERGADVRVFLDEGQIQPGEDLLMKAREARMADMVLVVFSRESIPSRWARAHWEGPLVREPSDEGVRMGFARADDCVPPAVLRPRFELAGLPLGSLRELKRWVRHRHVAYTPPAVSKSLVRDADLELLAIALADRAGVETIAGLGVAFEFARQFRDDFDDVLTLDCAGRSLTALAGDLGCQLGLQLEGDLEVNLGRLQEFCAARRFLVLLAGARPPVAGQLTFGGRCSTLISAEGGIQTEPDAVRRIQQKFASAGSTTSWTELCDLAREGRRLTTAQLRIAECHELMTLWHRAAEARADRKVLDESAREMVWILDGWGREEEARSLEYHRAANFDDQLPLPF